MNELVDEGFLILVAGGDSTAYTIACTTYYLLTHKACLQQLKKELQSASPEENGVLGWNNISKLPYLVTSMSILRLK